MLLPTKFISSSPFPFAPEDRRSRRITLCYPVITAKVRAEPRVCAFHNALSTEPRQHHEVSPAVPRVGHRWRIDPQEPVLSRARTGLATWLLSQTGVIFRSLPLRRACNSASNGCCGLIRFLAQRCCHCVYRYRVTSADVRKG